MDSGNETNSFKHVRKIDQSQNHTYVHILHLLHMLTSIKISHLWTYPVRRTVH